MVANHPRADARKPAKATAIRGVAGLDSAYVRGMEHLVEVSKQLSVARDLGQVMRVVRSAARRLTGADGATFVLRDGDLCFYADEDAIGPLWKGRRFPMKTCISGWSMEHQRAVVIEDIYQDSRIPAAAYRPTFVKSLAMVPIRERDPVGAIGTYWARRRNVHAEELRLLQALADLTSVALENVQRLLELERRAERDQLVAEASEALSGSLDYRETLADGARLVVDRLADSCIVDLLVDGEAVVDASASRVDAPGLDRLRQLRTYDAAAPFGIAEALRTGTPQSGER